MTMPEERSESKSETVSEKIEDALTGHDKPMSEEHPFAPAELVFMSYPIALIVILMAVLAVAWFFST